VISLSLFLFLFHEASCPPLLITQVSRSPPVQAGNLTK
jgi:hypothetical protein